MPVLKIKPTPKGEGGSKVVANPTLEGNEEALEGLEVEGTKYIVGGGSPELILGAELVALQGKHLDVDKLIALVQKYNLNNDTRKLRVGLTGSGKDYNTNWTDPEAYLINCYENSGTSISIVGKWVDDSGEGEGGDLIEFLTTNKVEIENFTVTIDDNSALEIITKVYQPTIGNDDMNPILITKQEILDLFVD